MFDKVRQTIDKVDTNGAAPLCALLERLHKENWFSKHQDTFHAVTRDIHHSCSGIKAGFVHVMQLVDYVVTDEQRKLLMTPIGDKVNPRVYSSLYSDIRQQCMAKMCEFEGDDYLLRKAGESKTPGQKHSSTVSALASRIKKYKNIINQTCGTVPLQIHRRDYTALVERSVLEAKAKKGTPEGNHSILKMFGQPSQADHVGSKRKLEDTDDFDYLDNNYLDNDTDRDLSNLRRRID